MTAAAGDSEEPWQSKYQSSLVAWTRGDRRRVALTLTSEWRPHRFLSDRQELLIGTWLATVRTVAGGPHEWEVVGAITGDPVASGTADSDEGAKKSAETAVQNRATRVDNCV